MSNLQTLAASTSQVSFPIDPRKKYSIIHKGYNISHSADTNLLYFAVATASADGGAGADKFFLTPNEAIEIGPGEYCLSYKCAAGAPVFSLSSIVATSHELAANNLS